MTTLARAFQRYFDAASAELETRIVHGAPTTLRQIADVLAPEPDDDGDEDDDTDIFEPETGDPGAHRPTVRKAVNR